MQRHVLVSSLRNEGPFILEWVAHHRVLGFDAIYIASNDCTDGSDRLLQALAAAGFIFHLDHSPARGEAPQHAGYASLRASFPIDQAEWLAILDTDEFLNIHIGNHRVQDLTAAAATSDVISLSARTFTDLPQTHWRPGPVTRGFPMALRSGHRANTAIKTLTRAPARFNTILNHHLTGCAEPGDLQVFHAQSGETRPLDPASPDRKRLRFLPVEEIGHAVAQYNHYAVKTFDSFLLRQQRGRGAVADSEGPANARHTTAYFASRSGKGRREPSILRYAAETDRLIGEMLANPAIAAAQRDCEAAHAAAIAHLIADGLLRP